MGRPGKSPTLFLKVGDALFVAEGRLLELDLICNSVNCDIAVFCERNIVLFPYLTEVFSDHLFEDLTTVVLGSGICFFEELLGAEESCGREQSQLLIGGRAETERISASTACLVQLADVSHDRTVSDCHINVTFVLKTPDIFMGVSNGVVAVDQIHEKSCVHHFEYPLWCVVFFVLLYSL